LSEGQQVNLDLGTTAGRSHANNEAMMHLLAQLTQSNTQLMQSNAQLTQSNAQLTQSNARLVAKIASLLEIITVLQRTM
jgi:hypothetical protein